MGAPKRAPGSGRGMHGLEDRADLYVAVESSEQYGLDLADGDDICR